MWICHPPPPLTQAAVSANTIRLRRLKRTHDDDVSDRLQGRARERPGRPLKLVVIKRHTGDDLIDSPKVRQLYEKPRLCNEWMNQRQVREINPSPSYRIYYTHTGVGWSVVNAQEDQLESSPAFISAESLPFFRCGCNRIKKPPSVIADYRWW